jgi:hypothetical protein
MHRGGNPALVDSQWTGRRWNGAQAYSDSKKPAHPAARDGTVQDRLLRCCAELTGAELPPA